MLIHNADITGSLLVNGTQFNTGSFSGSFTGIVAGTTATASYVEYNSVANKPALVSGSSQVTYSGLTGIPSGIVSGSSQVEYSGLTGVPSGIVSGSAQVTYSGLTGVPSGIVSGSSQVTYSGLTGVPSGIVSGSAQIASFGIFATTGSNGFNGSQSITGSLTVTGQVVAQTLNVQQVTSSIVYSSGSNIFGNSLSNVQQFTGSLQVSGSSHNILGNVGIGPTGTPSAELQVGKSCDVVIAMSNSSSVTSGNRGSLAWYNSSVSTVAIIRAAAVTDNVGTELQFYTRPAAGSLTQRLTLDSAGNLGLGVTPSAWGSSTFKVLDIGSTTSLYNDAGTILSENSFINSSFQYIYKTTNFASRYDQVSGNHRFFTAPSGTAGNAISFTQAMTLNASGNLSIGNTNDTYKLDVSGTGRFTGTLTVNHSTAGAYGAIIYNTSSTGEGLTVRGGSTSSHSAFVVQPYDGSVSLLNILASGPATFSSSVTAGGNVLVPAGSGLAWSGGASRIITPEDNVQGAKISTPGGFLAEASVFKFIGGNVGIGTPAPNRLTELISSSGGVLGVSTSANGSSVLYGRIAMYSNAGSNSYIDYGGEIRSYSGAGIDYSDLRFYTAGGSTSTERMRITSGGDTELVKTGIAAITNSTSNTLRFRNTQTNAQSVISGTIFTTSPSSWGGDMVFTTHPANGSPDDSTTEQMRITSDAYLRMASGSGGIQFNGDTAAANALDDYEEGTFTPTMTFGGGSTGITYFDRIGNYTKVGRHITCTIYLALTSKGSSTGNAQITGLPFAASGANRGTATAGSIRFNSISFVGRLGIQGQQSGTVIDFGQTTEAGVGTSLTNSNFSDSSEMFITITYFTA